MIVAKIEAPPLRIPFKPETQSDDSAWGDKIYGPYRAWNRPMADHVTVRWSGPPERRKLSKQERPAIT